MNCEIIRINDNTWRIEDGGVRFFLPLIEQQLFIMGKVLLTSISADEVRPIIADRNLTQGFQGRSLRSR